MIEHKPTTHQKTLELNFDPTWYGSLAEIGAGQEVGRWFFRVGAAAGTVAKTISAYDMQVSDAIYGKTDRYVSRARLEAMLEHEYELNVERLWESRGQQTRFFAFADTVAAQRFGTESNCHGWMGVRFQAEPLAPWSEIILHARLRDRDALMQHEALGVLGVNLISGAARLWQDPDALVQSLSDNLVAGRLEVDMIEFSGAAFGKTDNRVMSLKLVEHGLTQAAMFAPSGEALQPSEVLYKRRVLVQRGRFRPPTLVHADIQRRSIAALDASQASDSKPIVPLLEMSLQELRSVEASSVEDFLDRIEALGADEQRVLITNFETPGDVLTYLGECDTARIALTMNAIEFHALLAHGIPDAASNVSPTGTDDGLLELAHSLFGRNVQVFVYPAVDPSSAKRVEFQTLEWPSKLASFVSYLHESGRIVPLEGLPNADLRVHSTDVLELIRSGDPAWSNFVEPRVASAIRAAALFDLVE